VTGQAPQGSDRLEVDAGLVRRLVAAQFPQWAGLPVRPVELNGWDNTTFRLGERMKVRLPSAERYVAQVEKERRWLPLLAPHLPLPIPAPLARGEPGEDYPFPWSVYEWLDGEPASLESIDDLSRFATDLAGFLLALHGIDTSDGPTAGAHNFHRGGDLRVYDAETRRTIGKLGGEIDGDAAIEAWETALASRWERAPVWVHGDIAAGNLLVKDGRLAAVIDFGSSGVGDPACDLVVSWTLLDEESREAFRAALQFDADTWARARGWALWKALITLAPALSADPAIEARERRIIDAVLADHQRAD
jgi:aminoglycoside phosphotransferase (APT) family kinase protein